MLLYLHRSHLFNDTLAKFNDILNKLIVRRILNV